MASERPSLDALRIDRSEVEESGGRGRLCGGLFPAIRAARLPVATVLREL
jgi:hypothetical protein